jgi:hypothetical protein
LRCAGAVEVLIEKIIITKKTKAMNKLLLVFIVLGFAGQSWGQDNARLQRLKSNTIADKYRFEIERVFRAYNDSTQVVHPKTLQRNLNTIYQSIIPNNASLNDNTSSFSFMQSNEGQKIAVSTAFQFSEMSKNFLNIGISAEGKNGIFNLYSSNSWNNNTSLSFGYSRIIKSSQFYTLKDIKKANLKEKRKAFADSLSVKTQYNVLIGISNLTDRLMKYQGKMESLKNLDLSDEDVNEKLEDTIALYDKKIKLYIKKISEYEYLEKQVIDDNVNRDVADKFSEFDTKNDVLYGYSVFWGQISSKLMNNTYVFKEATNNEESISKSVFHADIRASLMWNREGLRTSQFVTFGLSSFMGSYLSDPTFRNFTPVINNGTITHEGNIIGTVNDLSTPVWQYSFNIYYANFFAFKKHLGLSLNGVYNNAFESKLAGNYKGNYTAAIGPIFKVRGEENWAKATFGLSAGWENLPEKGAGKDYFTLKAYVGVPFNVFSKKNK